MVDKFNIDISGSVFPVLHNKQGDKVYLNCPKQVSGAVCLIEVWLHDQSLPPDNSLIKVIKGHFDMRLSTTTGVHHIITKKAYSHYLPRLYVYEYEILGENPEILTEE